jgi:hypothetical protein
LGRRARGRRKKCEPGRGHYDKDRPAIIAWVSRQGGVVIQATRDFTVQTVQKAADIAVHTGSRLYTDSASSYRALKGYMHAFVNHTQKGSVSDLHFIGLDPQAEFIPIDKQSEDNVMHLNGLGKADRLTHQTFDPGA